MSRSTHLFATALLVVLVCVALPGVVTAQASGADVAQQIPEPTFETGELSDSSVNDSDEHDDTAGEAADSDSPGANLSGVIASEQQTIDGELRTNEYAIRLERAETPEERAQELHAIAAELQSELETTQSIFASLQAGEHAHPGQQQYHSSAVAVGSSFLTQHVTASKTVAASIELEVDDEAGTDIHAQFESLDEQATNIHVSIEADASVDITVTGDPDDIDISVEDMLPDDGDFEDADVVDDFNLTEGDIALFVAILEAEGIDLQKADLESVLDGDEGLALNLTALDEFGFDDPANVSIDDFDGLDEFEDLEDLDLDEIEEIDWLDVVDVSEGEFPTFGNLTLPEEFDEGEFVDFFDEGVGLEDTFDFGEWDEFDLKDLEDDFEDDDEDLEDDDEDLEDDDADLDSDSLDVDLNTDL